MARTCSLRTLRLSALLSTALLATLLVSACTPQADSLSDETTVAPSIVEAGTPELKVDGAVAEEGTGAADSGAAETMLSGTVSPPSVLPPGAGVAYVDIAGLNYIDSDGPRLLLPGLTEAMAVPSPDGKWVAYLRRQDDWSSDTLSIVSTETGESKDLVATNDLELPDDFDAVPEPRLRLLSSAEWAADGASLYFNTFVGPGPGTENPPPPVFADDLWKVDVATGEVSEVLAQGDGGRYVFSPDGSMIAVAASGWNEDTDATLSVSDADGGNRRELLSFPRAGDAEIRLYAQPYWSDDGDSIRIAAFEEQTTIEEMPQREMVLHTVSLAGDVDTVGGLPGAAGRLGGPTYVLPLSPTGDRMAMVMLPDEATPSPTDTDTSGPTPLPTAVPPAKLVFGDTAETGDWSALPAYEVASLIRLGEWSPDGERLMYSAKRSSEHAPAGENAFYVGRPGQDPSRIVDATRLMRVQWLGSDHLILMLMEETPWLVLATVDGKLDLLAKLADPGDERPPHTLSVVHPHGDDL